MQIKTTRSCHLTPDGVAVIKKTRNNERWRGCGEKETLVPLLVGNGAATMETGWMLLKQLKIQLPDDPAIPFLDIYPKESNTSKKYLHPHALCSIIHNSQGMEAT